MITISRFSGKSDFCDTIMIFGAENIISKYKVYDQRHILPFEIKESKDLIPYYPYLVASMASNKETGGVIYLSQESYINSEEKDHIQWQLNSVLRYWRRCKKKKEKFDTLEALSCIVWPADDLPQDFQLELVKRVEELGDKATIDDLHDKIHDMYRKELFDEMVNNGWNENRAGTWIYGWQRWNKEFKKE